MFSGTRFMAASVGSTGAFAISASKESGGCCADNLTVNPANRIRGTNRDVIDFLITVLHLGQIGLLALQQSLAGGLAAGILCYLFMRKSYEKPLTETLLQ